MVNTKAIIMARVGTPPQGTKRTMLPEQIKELTEYARKKNLAVVKQYSLIGSALRWKIDNILKKATKDGVKAIVCSTFDRITRSAASSLQLSRWLAEDKRRAIHVFRMGTVLKANKMTDLLLVM